MGKNLGINIKIGADLKNFSTDMQNVSRQMKRTGAKMQSVGKSLTRNLSLPLGLIGGAMIKMASDTQESLNKVDVAFGNSSKQVKDFANTTLKGFGIANGSALEMASTFGDMATSMGIGQGEAAQMSTKLVGLAGDLASFKNIRIDVAQTALNSIFTGETESLKKLGIVMTQANLSAFALEKGIQKPITAMSEGEKVMLRYNFVMEKTSNAHGDFERTGGGAANQMRIFQEGLKEVAEKFGNLVLPMFTKVVHKLNELVTWFGTLSDSTKKTILVIGAIVAVIGPLIFVLGSLKIAIAGLIPSLAKMGIAITGSLGPLGLIIGGLALLGIAIYKVVKANQKYSAVSKDVIANIQSEKAGMNAMFEALKVTTVGTDDRRKAVEELNTRYGEYLPNQVTEKDNLEDIEAAQSAANGQLLKSIVLKSKAADIEAQSALLIEKTKDAMSDLSRESKKAKTQSSGFLKKVTEDQAKAFEIGVISIINKLNDTSSQEAYTSSLKDIRTEINNLAKSSGIAVTETRTFGNAILGLVNADVDRKNNLVEINEEYEKMAKLLGINIGLSKKTTEKKKNLLLFDPSGGEEEITEKRLKNTRDYLAQLAVLKINAIENEKKRLLDAQEYEQNLRIQDIKDSVADEGVKQQLITAIKKEGDAERLQIINDLKDKAKASALESALELVEKENLIAETGLIKRYLKAESTQEQHEKELLDQKISYLEAKKQVLIKYGKDVADIENQIAMQQKSSADASISTFKDFSTRMSELGTELNTMFKDLLSGAAFDFFDALGQEMAGSTKAIDRMGIQVLGSLGDFLGKFGQMLMAAAVASEAFQTALFAGPAGAAVAFAAGAALVVISGAIKQHVKKASEGMNNLGGGGGFDTSYDPTTYTNNFGNYQGSSIMLETTVYGQDILLASTRAGDTVDRTRRK
jgi:hypothetical protein